MARTETRARRIAENFTRYRTLRDLKEHVESRAQTAEAKAELAALRTWAQQECAKIPSCGLLAIALHRERLERLAAWLESRRFATTRRQIADAFPEYYESIAKGSAGERMMCRDLNALVATGKFARTYGKIIRADRASVLRE